jgi:hypothetical protein
VVAAPVLVAYLRESVLPTRLAAAEREAERNRELLEANPGARLNRHDANFLDKWWRLGYRRTDMVQALEGLDRYIALSRVAIEARQSVYAFVSSGIRPSDALQVFAFDDDYSFGILHSTYHRAYFEERCSKMRVDLRYTPNAVFDTFPWPQAPTPEWVAAVANAAARLVDFQQERLADGMGLGQLYDLLRDPGRNPLRTLQGELDQAVADVYGFDREEDVLAQLLALNQSIADEEAAGITRPRGPGALALAGTRLSDRRIEAPAF